MSAKIDTAGAFAGLVDLQSSATFEPYESSGGALARQAGDKPLLVDDRRILVVDTVVPSAKAPDPFVCEVHDAGADQAIAAFFHREITQDIVANLSDRSNHMTGDGVTRTFLEATADPGNEAAELGRVIQYLNQNAGKVDAGGERVKNVAEQWRNLAIEQGGSLTEDQKAQMAHEMNAAAQPINWLPVTFAPL